MAVRKKDTTKAEVKTEETKVDETPVVVEEPQVGEESEVTVDSEENVSEGVTEEAPEEKEPEVVVEQESLEEEKKETEQPEVKVDVEGSVVKKEEQPERNVRIKMGADHKCCIGGEWYNLKKGQCYNVPVSVKNILMQVEGLLLPL